jgi:hypothetical protein
LKKAFLKIVGNKKFVGKKIILKYLWEKKAFFCLKKVDSDGSNRR